MRLYDYPSAVRLWIVRVLLLLSVVLGSIYFVWRMNPAVWGVWWLSVPLMVTEVIFFLGYLVHVPILWLKKRPPLVLPKQIPATSIDILIPTFNEDWSVLEPTITSALAVTVPNRATVQVVVLDDGNRPELQKRISTLAQKVSLPLHYFTRSDHEHAKAGNLNAYLFNHCQAEYLIILDCDHVPEVSIVTELYPYTVLKEVGLVQAPQVFKNIPPHDPLGQNPDFWFGILELGRYGWDSLVCCGTPTLWSTKALKSIGGYQYSVTEDFATGVRLQAVGYKIVYHPYKLAVGLASEDLDDAMKKIVRYSTGAFDILRWQHTLPNPNRLSMMQRWLHFTYPLLFFLPVLLPIFLFIPIISVLTHLTPYREMPVYILGTHTFYIASMQAAFYILAPHMFWRMWQYYLGTFPAVVSGLLRFLLGNKTFLVSRKGGVLHNSFQIVKFPFLAFILGCVTLIYGTLFQSVETLIIRFPALVWIALNNALLIGVIQVPVSLWVTQTPKLEQEIL